MKLVYNFNIIFHTSLFDLFYCLAPCNLYPTPNIKTDNISWLYEALAENWIKLGLPADTRDSILYGAFYTTVIRPGLRLISLNMNYCTTDNYWIVINSTDPLNQLQWVRFFFNKKQISKYIVYLANSMVTICRRSRRKSTYHCTSTSFFLCCSIQLELL